MLHQNTKKVLHYLLPLLLALLLTFTYVRVVFAATSVGAVNNWLNVSGASQLSVNMTPNKGEAGYHFYSLSTFFQGENYGMYSGIQTNGNLGNGVDVGNIFIFSVWNATEAYPLNGSTATPFGGEGDGYSLRVRYNWTVGRTYTVSLTRGAYDQAKNGYRWSSTIKDTSTGSSLKIGEILAPSGADLLSGGSVFHERYGGSAPVCTSSTSNLEAASVTFSGLSNNGSGGLTGTAAPNNIFNSSSCSTFIHAYTDTNRAVTGFGISQTEFAKLLSGSTGSSSSDGNSSPSTSRNPTSAPNQDPSTNTSDRTTETDAENKPVSQSDKSINVDTDSSQNLTLQSEKSNNDNRFGTAAGASTLTSLLKGNRLAQVVGLMIIPLVCGSLFVLLRFHILKV